MTATQSIIKVTEQSACFGHRGVTAFTERRVTGVSIILTFCVNLLRFALSYYVLGNVTFCGPYRGRKT